MLIVISQIGRKHMQHQPNTARVERESRRPPGRKYVGEAEAAMTDFNKRGKRTGIKTRT